MARHHLPSAIVSLFCTGTWNKTCMKKTRKKIWSSKSISKIAFFPRRVFMLFDCSPLSLRRRVTYIAQHTHKTMTRRHRERREMVWADEMVMIGHKSHRSSPYLECVTLSIRGGSATKKERKKSFYSGTSTCCSFVDFSSPRRTRSNSPSTLPAAPCWNKIQNVFTHENLSFGPSEHDSWLLDDDNISLDTP